MLPKLNQELDLFVDNYINNFIKWDLLVFFYQNPELSDTCDSVATRLGRRLDDVDSALNDLVSGGILQVGEGGRAGSFHYAPSREKRQLVEQFIGALDSREQRLQILTKLLRMGARG